MDTRPGLCPFAACHGVYVSVGIDDLRAESRLDEIMAEARALVG
ncbi:hypothetical protein [Paracoccus limosus]|nr:hypothetical protein [Paracoccus limosus]